MINDKYFYDHYENERNENDNEVEMVGVGNYFTALGNYTPSVGFIKVQRDY